MIFSIISQQYQRQNLFADLSLRSEYHFNISSIVAFAFVLFSFHGATDKNLAPFNAYAKFYFIKFCKQVARFLLVGLRGLEPPTSRLSGVRSNHLNYKPMSVFGDGRRFFVFRRPLVEMRRIELLTPCLQGRCSPS